VPLHFKGIIVHKTIIFFLFTLLGVIISTIVQAGTSTSSSLNYISTARVQPQVIMAGVSPAILELTDTSFDIVGLIRPGTTPIQSVVLTQSGNALFILPMTLRTTLSNGDQLWGYNYTFLAGSFGTQTIPVVWGASAGNFSIQVVDTIEQKSPAFPAIRSGDYLPLISCSLPQVLQNNVCVTPSVTCYAPQLRNAQTNTCYTPDVTCYAPQVRDASTNVCVTAYTIGGTGPAGGIVFSVDSSGLHGLEAKATDEVWTFYWVDAMNAPSAYESNWYVPTRDELKTLYFKKTVVGGFANDWYWSSTSSGYKTAWNRSFGSGYESDAGTSFIQYRVRLIQAF